VLLPIGPRSGRIFIQHHFAAPFQVLGELARRFIFRRLARVSLAYLSKQQVHRWRIGTVAGDAQQQLPLPWRQTIKHRLDAGRLADHERLAQGFVDLRLDLLSRLLAWVYRQWKAPGLGHLTQAVETGDFDQPCQ